jgi:hypothetical protein
VFPGTFMARSGFRLQGPETGEVGGEGGRERGRWDGMHVGRQTLKSKTLCAVS